MGKLYRMRFFGATQAIFGFTSEIGGDSYFQIALTRMGENCGKPANDEDISFFLPWRRSNKKSVPFRIRLVHEDHWEGVFAEGPRPGKCHPCSALLRDVYVRVTRSGGGSVSSEESDTARQSARVRQGRRCRAHKKGEDKSGRFLTFRQNRDSV